MQLEKDFWLWLVSRTDRHAYDLFSVGHLQLPEQPDILETCTVQLDVFFRQIMSS